MPAALASAALGMEAWDAAHGELVALLRELILIPSVNPPDPPGPELDVANHLAAVFLAEGLEPEVLEPAPGRGVVTVRLRSDGTAGDPLLLLSHLDVVPARAEDGWTHGPFDADVANGYVWGRGAVDMKQMVALEAQVIRMLARRARAAGVDPARDPIPGLRRDVLFTSTPDEEAGGIHGVGWLADHRPDTLQAALALNEVGGVTIELAGRRFYPIQVAEKGFEVYRVHVRGTWGHGSMPREDNAVVLAAEVVRRLAAPGEPRLTAPMRTFLDGIAANLPPDQAELVAAIGGDDPRRSEAAIRALCSPPAARALRALLRDTISPDVIHGGVKYNVIPGEAVVDIDCRTLPGTTPDDMREELLARLGDLAPFATLEYIIGRSPVDNPVGEAFELLAATIRAHDPDGIPLPVMVPFATDAKTTTLRLGIPTYGFTPLRLDPEESFLERFHGVDERVGLDALRWGLPVLYDVVAAYCG
jgi:acetylornithine deacetylase/succinyl-diaminopimelate desuccinylase-like protein